MYFVDREKIHRTLGYMDKIYAHYLEMEEKNGLTNELTIERIASMVIESIIDVGNSMIDGFIMRDPGGYEDILDILDDEKVISPEDAKSLKSLILLRKHLVQEFTEVDHERIIQGLDESKEALIRFSKEVERYLTEELGPVSAFLPHE